MPFMLFFAPRCDNAEGCDNADTGVLGDQEPCTADRGCKIVSVEIVDLLSNLLSTCRAGVLQSPSTTSSL